MMESIEPLLQLPAAPEACGLRLFSVGDSTQTMPQFVALLQRAGVTAVADVRTAPYSRFCPQFNKAGLEGALRETGIAYVLLGAELGGRPAAADLYDDD